jgi:dTDP-glucose pyrophosphorylase
MKPINKIVVSPDASIKEVLKIIDQGALRIALVINDSNKLLGTLTDGDIRRALLKGKTINDAINTLYNRNPVTSNLNEPKDTLIRKACQSRIYQIPVVDDNGILVGIEDINEYLVKKPYDNIVILMVGGLGTRLQPLTEKVPKPLLKIGDKSVLETIIHNFSSSGFSRFIFSVNYKSQMIRDYFQDGKPFGVQISYMQEEKKMGTVGSLSLLKQKPKEPFFVMNGDILTNINLEHLLDYHLLNKADATVSVREINFEIPYGVIHHDDKKIIHIKEKPTQKMFINAGIYLLNPVCLDHLPPDKYVDMPDFLNFLIKSGLNVISFPIREYWLDIGQMEDLDRAQSDYNNLFNS